jgi:hypothetical protein
VLVPLTVWSDRKTKIAKIFYFSLTLCVVTFSRLILNLEHLNVGAGFVTDLFEEVAL